MQFHIHFTWVSYVKPYQSGSGLILCDSVSCLVQCRYIKIQNRSAQAVLITIIMQTYTQTKHMHISFSFTLVCPWISKHDQLSIKSYIILSQAWHHITSHHIKLKYQACQWTQYANKYFSLSSGTSLLQWGTSLVTMNIKVKQFLSCMASSFDLCKYGFCCLWSIVCCVLHVLHHRYIC